MSLQRILLLALTSSLLNPFAFSATDTSKPVIQLDRGTFTGTRDGIVDKYLGVPFGKST
jgi:hypothetical protein